MEGDYNMKHKQFMPLNLQLFAEEGTQEKTPDNAQETFNVDGLSDEQLAAIKEKFKLKDDKDVDSIIKNKRNRWQQDYEAKIEQERNEAAELAKLSEKERQQALIDKEKKQLEEERAAFNRERLLVEKGKQLREIGVPDILANRIGGDTAEEALEDVKAFKQLWDKALESAVNERLKSSVDSPLSGDSKNNKANPFAKETLNLTEQGRLFREDPEQARMLQALANK